MVVSSLWHKDVPLKVVLFAWRLFRDRLPTKDNLHRRGVIDHASTVCVSGCGSMESSNHLSIGGLVYQRLFRFMCRTILINLVSSVVFPRCAAQLFRSSGSLRCEKFGRKEITGSLMIKTVRLLRW